MRVKVLFTGFFILLFVACNKDNNDLRLREDSAIDHTCTELAAIPAEWITAAKTTLHIAYGHTSHGSQITTGMKGLVSFKGNNFEWNNGGTGGALDLHDYAMPGDLGNPNRTQWEAETRKYLAANSDINVVMWSWCGQVSSATEADINTYLSLMTGLEEDFPNVTFVYMTGHLDGTGLTGNLHFRNEQIRNYCKTNKKFLYDFADIESYDPDGIYYGDKFANDGCNYDYDGDGETKSSGDPSIPGGNDKNWAITWQNNHTVNVDWFNTSVAHTQPLNGNLKAYAAWHLWALIAGWDGN